MPEKPSSLAVRANGEEVASETRHVEQHAEQDREPEQDEQRDRQLGFGDVAAADVRVAHREAATPSPAEDHVREALVGGERAERDRERRQVE